ncbi:hypothetical protein VNO80_30047 [Phaseolus coccineus]|uniref:Uncharacterized protein n=1 Tax=Phaseolus coccineus TaxID=3886 RepID=A0AAN9LC44_PHACN
MRSPVNSLTRGGSGSYRSGVCVFSYNTTICVVHRSNEHGNSDHGCGANERGQTHLEVYGTRSVCKAELLPL